MSSDSSSNPPPTPDSSSSSTTPPAADDSQSPPPPSQSSPSPPPPTASSPPPPAASSPPPPAASSPPPPASSPPPPSSSPPPPAPSNSGGKSPPTPPPPSGKSPPPPSGSDKKSPPPPKSKSSHLSPPSRSRNDHPRSNSSQLEDASGNQNDSSNQTAIIAGIAGGAVLLLAVLIASMICCCIKKKRKKPNHDLQYYRDSNNPHENMNNYYSNPPSSEYMVKIPPPPAPGSAAVSSEYGWSPAPPPPPPNMHSSDMSSAGFSGPYGTALPPPHPSVALGFNQSSFTYEDLSAATGGFAQVNLLGQGGFGFVHKGVLPNGKEIAVKSLKLNSGQGEREFHAEVDIISRVHHRHLVSLVGYCSTGSQRLLVYEFVDNGTLEQHLHGTGKPFLDWPTRHRIALGAAKGFAYLHEDCHPRIIHRDIKAANILIDSNCEAKVADFGLAKLSNDNLTHVSTRIMGTFGYLAPEYASTGKLTEKSDVYSFGIMLLELITGRRPVDISSDDDSLVDWARPILMKVQEGGSYEELVDPRLGNDYDPNEMLHMVACAGACIRHSSRGRPKMSQIVRALEGDVSLDDLNNVPKITSTQMSSAGSDYDMRRFGKGGLSSQEYSSSEEHTVDFHSRS